MKHLWFVCGNNSRESVAVIKYLVHREQLLVLILEEDLNPENEFPAMLSDQVKQYMVKDNGKLPTDLSSDIRQLIHEHGHPHKTIIFDNDSLFAQQLSNYFSNHEPGNVICFKTIMKK